MRRLSRKIFLGFPARPRSGCLRNGAQILCSATGKHFRNLLNTIGFHAEWNPDTVRKNREVIEDFLRFYESEAPERHSVSVTMANIRAVWQET